MRNKLSIASIIAVFIMCYATISFAATGSVELRASVTQAKREETFTVTVSATSSDGINGIDTKYTYDTNGLELVSANVVNSSNWSSLGVDQDITVICNTTSKVTNADIYVLTFKVKNTATIGSKLKVETTEIVLDTDLATNSEVTIPAKVVEIEVIANETPGTNPSDKDLEGEGQTPGTNPSEKDPEGEEQAPGTDPSEKEPEGEEQAPGTDPSEKDPEGEGQTPGTNSMDKNQNGNQQNSGANTSNKTQNFGTNASGNSQNTNTPQTQNVAGNSNNVNASNTQKTLPYTGVQGIMVCIFIIIVGIMIAIISYKKYQKYKGI